MVVVQHHEFGCLCCRGNQQIRNLGTALLASPCKLVLDRDCSIEDGLIHGYKRPCRAELPHGSVRCRACGGESGFQVSRCAPRYESTFKQRYETFGDHGLRHPRQRGRVPQVIRPQPHADWRSSESASSLRSTPCSASSARRRAARARTSSNALSTVAFKVPVSRSVLTASSLLSSTSISRFVMITGYPKQYE